MKKFEKLLKSQVQHAFEGTKEEKDIIKNKIGINKSPNMNNYRWRLPLTISIAFAVIAIIAAIIIPTTIIDNNVPTYLKMTVEKYDNTSLANYSNNEFDELFELGDESVYEYYATKGEVVLLKIQIKNPKSYEILSITINDTKIQSFTFDPEYPSEVILIPYKVMEESGLEEIVLNEFKYVDGNKIKNGRINSNSSILIGVSYEELPEIASFNTVVGYSDIKFNILINDINLLIKDKMLKLVITDENKIIKSININTNDNVIIDGLSPNTIYNCYIIAAIDSLDGNGYTTNTLHYEAIETKKVVDFSDINITSSSISFKLDNLDNAIINKIYLLDNDNKYEINDYADNLLSKHKYIIEVNYTYLNNSYITYYEFDTLENSIDVITSSDIAAIIILDSIEVVVDNYIHSDYVTDITINLYDGSNILSSTNIYQVEENVLSASLTQLLESNKQYKLEIVVKYDLNDGSGLKEYTVNKNIMKAN